MVFSANPVTELTLQPGTNSIYRSGTYRVTGGDGEKWEPDFYVTRECLVAALRDAYDEASFSGAICVPRVEPAPDPNRRRTHAF